MAVVAVSLQSNSASALREARGCTRALVGARQRDVMSRWRSVARVVYARLSCGSSRDRTLRGARVHCTGRSRWAAVAAPRRSFLWDRLALVSALARIPRSVGRTAARGSRRGCAHVRKTQSMTNVYSTRGTDQQYCTRWKKISTNKYEIRSRPDYVRPRARALYIYDCPAPSLTNATSLSAVRGSSRAPGNATDRYRRSQTNTAGRSPAPPAQN